MVIDLLGRISPRGPGSVLKVDALTPLLTVDEAARISDRLPEEALPAALKVAGDIATSRQRAAATFVQKDKTRDANALERIANLIDTPLRAIESSLFSYFALRRSLSDIGLQPIGQAIGTAMTAARLDPARHELRGAPGAARYVVRSSGIQIAGVPASRAVVEPERQDEEPAS